MDLEQHRQTINVFQRDSYFRLRYNTGYYHKQILQLLKLNDLEELKNYFIALMPQGTCVAVKDPKLTRLESEIKKLEEDFESARKNEIETHHIYHDEWYKKEKAYETTREKIQEELKLLYRASYYEDEERKEVEEITDFYFAHIKYSWWKNVMPNMETFVSGMRQLNALKKEELPILDNWQNVLLNALDYKSYDISKEFHRRHLSSRIPKLSDKEEKDNYQILSAYLLAIKKAFTAHEYRLDEQGRVQINFKNSLMATLSIKELPLKSHFNEAEIDKVISSNAISYSGYDKSIYVLNALHLYFEGYHLEFRFQAYSVLMNGMSHGHNAAARLYDDEQQRLQDEQDEYDAY